MSDVWEMRACRETSGLREGWDGVEGLEPRRLWSGNGYGRFGKRPSSMRGMRESISSSERRGNGEKRSGWMRDWRVRVWWVRCEVMEE